MRACRPARAGGHFRRTRLFRVTSSVRGRRLLEKNRENTETLIRSAILLVFLLAWKSYSFRIREDMHWAVSDYLICYAQDVILWALLYVGIHGMCVVSKKWVVAAHLIVLNAALVFQMIDSRVKVLFLEPLSVQLIGYSCGDLEILSSQMMFFWGKKYWPAFLLSIAAFNLLPLMLSSLMKRYARSGSAIGVVGGKVNNFICGGKLTVMASLILPLSAAIVVTGSEEIYGLNKNFIISSLVDPLKKNNRIAGDICESEQKVYSLRDRGHERKISSFFGLAANRNVILYILESTSYEDSLGANRRAMPFINGLLGSGGIALPCYTQCATSTKSVFTVLSGLHSGKGFEIIESRIRNAGGITRVLRERGYYTAFITAQNLSYQGMRNMVQNFGFDHVVEYENLRSLAGKSGIVVKDVGFGASDDRLMLLSDIHEFPSQKLFLVYYTSSSHYPYDFPGAGPGCDKDRHERSLAYSDYVFSLLYKMVSENNMARDTLFIVTADHGEEFYDGKFKGRGTTLSEATHRVPLVFYGSGIRFPALESGIARQVDIGVSLLELLGIKDCDFRTQGTSIFAAGRRETPVFINTYGLMDSMGIIENGKKFVYSFDSGKMWLYENTKGGEVKKEIRDVETIRRYSARMNTFDAYNSNHLKTLLDSGDKR